MNYEDQALNQIRVASLYQDQGGDWWSKLTIMLATGVIFALLAIAKEVRDHA